MAFPPATVCCVGCVAAFAPALSLEPGLVGWRSSWMRSYTGSSSTTGSRLSDVPALRVVDVEGLDGPGQQQEDEDIPNLFPVTPVPTYEEMLAWAEETDRRIAAGQLPPLGSSRNPSDATEAAAAAAEAGATATASQGLGANFLSDEEQAQMATVAELLGKRRKQGSSLSGEEESILRTAMAGLSASVDIDKSASINDRDALDSNPGSSPPPSSPFSSAPVSGDGVGGGAEDFVHNQIYGSREVRDKVYLYAWSLMKDSQEKAEREAAGDRHQRE